MFWEMTNVKMQFTEKHYQWSTNEHLKLVLKFVILSCWCLYIFVNSIFLSWWDGSPFTAWCRHSPWTLSWVDKLPHWKTNHSIHHLHMLHLPKTLCPHLSNVTFSPWHPTPTSLFGWYICQSRYSRVLQDKVRLYDILLPLKNARRTYVCNTTQ